MLKVISTLPKGAVFRFSTKVAEKSSKTDSFLIEDDVNGMTVITIKPKVHTISKIAAVFNAGSRMERYDSRGMNHLLRRSAGLSCGDLTPVGVTRHLQQMGSNLRCFGTRETLSYVVDFSFDMFHKVGEILSHVTTRQKFYNWELKENVKPLMLTDIQLLNRRDFDTLCSELLHKAAFRDSLGNSLYADEYQLGEWNIDKIEDFLDHTFTAGKSMLVGVSVNHDDLVRLAEGFKIRPLKDSQASVAQFRGGEMRRELPLEFAKVMLAWEAPGFNSIKCALATSLLSYSVDNGINNRIKWNNGSLELIKRVTSDHNVNEHCVANSVHISYSDKGLFGFNVTGEPDIMDAAVRSLHKHFTSIGTSGVAKPEFDIAKTLLVHDLLMRSESNEGLVENVISQAYSTNDVVTVEGLVAEIGSITLDDVNKLAKSIFSSSNKVAMAAVGNLSTVPFVTDLH